MESDETKMIETFSIQHYSNIDLCEDEYNVNNSLDLQTYYMAQFNLELEFGAQAKRKTILKNGDELIHTNGEYTNIQTDWVHNMTDKSSLQASNIIINQTSDFLNNKNIEPKKNQAYSESEITLDGHDCSVNEKLDFEAHCIDDDNSDYIDDEQLIMEELCKVDDNVACRLSPDLFTEEFLSAITKGQNLLPPMEKAFSKHYCNYTNRDASIPQNGSNICNNLDITAQDSENALTINNLDNYSYPNNIFGTMSPENIYALPDTPTSSVEFSFEGSKEKRKVSTCESIESDLQSTDYFDEGTGNIEDDEIFMNLDDLGLQFENEDDSIELDTINEQRCKSELKHGREKYYGERICFWESCFEKYPNQAMLVEHIERQHVNTFKGEEFSCLWSECARSRRPFNARYKLLIHMRVHSGHKPNRCNHPGCGKAFSRLENLKIHVRSHTGERPYACPAPHCRKAFSNSSDRAKHQRTHFNARPYACGAVGCGKRYTDPSSLRKHVKTHPHTHVFAHTHVYTPPPRVDKMAAKVASKMADCRPGASPHSPVKLHTIRSIRNKLAPELLLRAQKMF